MIDFKDSMMEEVEQVFRPNSNFCTEFAPLVEGARVGAEQCEECGNCVYERRGNYMVCVTDEYEQAEVGYTGCGTRYKIFEEVVKHY